MAKSDTTCEIHGTHCRYDRHPERTHALELDPWMYDQPDRAYCIVCGEGPVVGGRHDLDWRTRNGGHFTHLLPMTEVAKRDYLAERGWDVHSSDGLHVTIAYKIRHGRTGWMLTRREGADTWELTTYDTGGCPFGVRGIGKLVDMVERAS